VTPCLGGDSAFFISLLDDRPPKRITDLKEQYARFFDLSRDGKTIVVTRGVIINDLVLITIKLSPKSKAESPKPKAQVSDFGLWTLDFGL
jgi:hypothetical protein